MNPPVELNLRRIGGSDVAAILGVSDYSTAFDVWLRIVEGFASPSTPAMERGKRFERAIAEWWASEERVEIEWFGASIEHTDRPWQRLTPDLRVLSRPGEIADVKRTRRPLDRHGHPGTDEIADYELVQLQTYLEGLYSLGVEAEVGRLVVHDYAESDELLTWSTRRDPELGATIVEACERFWRDHVVTKRPPEISGSRNARNWIDRRRPLRLRQQREATESETRLALELKDVELGMRALEARRDVLRNRIRETISDVRGIRGPFGAISYSTISEQCGPDWRAIAEDLATDLAHERLPESAWEQQAKPFARMLLEEISAEHQHVTREAYQRFATHWKREG